MIIVNNIKLNIDAPQQQAVAVALKKLGIPKSEIADSFIHKMSVDARGDIKFVYSVGVNLVDAGKEQLFTGKNKDGTVKNIQPLVIPMGE